jgi:hypothetical protein
MEPRPGIASMMISIFSIRRRMKGIGRRLPRMQRGIARRIGTFKRAGDAARRPPLSSRMGIIEMMKMMVSPEILPLSAAITLFIKFVVMIYFNLFPVDILKPNLFYYIRLQ